jgi:hypothetical protein
MQDLITWQDIKARIALMKTDVTAEQLLRKKIFAGFFPAPVEGTNTYNLAAGYVLKASYPIDRKVDNNVFLALKATLVIGGIPVDSIVTYEPKLVMSEYRKLTAEQQALMDQCMDVKPGSLSMEIVLPAANKTKGETA